MKRVEQYSHLLDYSIKLAGELQKIHAENIIYGELRPENIKTLPGGKIFLERFPESSERTSFEYFAPEEMENSVPVDARLDLYYLGINLYHRAAGHTPFSNRPPQSVLDAHKNEEPPYLGNIDNAPPGEFCETVHKLLAKNPADRYENSGMVVYILENIREKSKGFSPEAMIPFYNINFCQPLAGLQNELDSISRIFRRVFSGHTSGVFVTGAEGSGKSRLIKEFAVKTAARGHLFCGIGSFRSARKNLPYKALVESINQIIERLFSYDVKAFKEWGKKVKKILGPTAPLLKLLFPVTATKDKTTEVPEVLLEHMEKHLLLFFVDIIKTLTRYTSSMILVLEDMEEADRDSLKMINQILSCKLDKKVLFLFSARNTESELLKDVYKKCVLSLELPVYNKELAHRYKFIYGIDTSVLEDENGNICSPLHCEFRIKYWKIMKKLFSSGNSKLPQTLNETIKAVVKTMDFSELPIIFISAMAEENFSFSFVKQINPQYSSEKIFKSLCEGVRRGVLKYCGNYRFRFVHKHVHAVISSMISREFKLRCFLVLARYSSDSTRWKNPTNFFNAAKYYNASSSLLTTFEEKLVALKANIIAAKYSQSFASHDISLSFLNSASVFVDNEMWRKEYEKIKSFYEIYAESAFLSGDIKLFEKIFSILIEKSKNEGDTASVYKMKIRLYTIVSDFEKAVETGRKALGELKITMPEKRAKLSVILKYPGMIRDLSVIFKKKRKILPVSDKGAEAVMALLDELFPVVIISRRPFLSIWLVSKIIELTVKYGFTASSTHALIFFGAGKSFFGSYSDALKYGKKGLSIAERIKNMPVETEIRNRHLFADVIMPWSNHLKDSFVYYQKAVDLALEAGIIEFINYSTIKYIFAKFSSGIPLYKFKKDISRGEFILERYADSRIRKQLEIIKHLMNVLIGNTEPVSFEIPENFDDTIALFTSIFIMKYYYYTEQYDAAAEVSEKIAGSIDDIMNNYQYASYAFYRNMLICRGFLCAEKKHLRKATAKFKKWSKLNPENFQHIYTFFEAVKGCDRENIKLSIFEKVRDAADKAEKNGFVNHEAVFYEYLAETAQKNGYREMELVYFLKAKDRYRKWGAVFKVLSLEKRFSHLISSKDHFMVSDSTEFLFSELSFFSLADDINSFADALVDFMKKNIRTDILTIFPNIENLPYFPVIRIEKNGFDVYDSKENNKEIYPVETLKECLLKGLNFRLDSEINDFPENAESYFKNDRLKSALCFPARFGDRIFAALLFENRHADNAYPGDITHMIKMMVSQLIPVMKNISEKRKLENKISEMKSHAKEMERLEMQLFSMQKMEAVSQSIAAMTHEFKNYLTRIQGFSELIEDMSGDPTICSFTSDILDAAEESRKLISRMSSHSRQDVFQGADDYIDVLEMLEEVADIVQKSSEAAISVETIFLYNRSAIVKGNGSELRQVFMNIAFNGCYAMKKIGKGVLRITLDKKNVVDKYGKRSIFVISVSDEGTGMDKQVLQHIFTPFFTTKPEGEGTGMGLPLSKRIVEKCGGKVTVRSEKGKGSEFTVTLPEAVVKTE